MGGSSRGGGFGGGSFAAPSSFGSAAGSPSASMRGGASGFGSPRGRASGVGPGGPPPSQQRRRKSGPDFDGDELQNISGSGRVERNKPLPKDVYIGLTRADMADMHFSDRPIFKYLKEGFQVFKVGRWGFSGGAYRMLWLDVSDQEHPQLRWNAGGERDASKAKRMELRRIGDLSAGIHSEKLQARGKSAMAGQYMSFKSQDDSGKEVSLDLRFDSEEERDWFFNRFNELLHAYAEVFGKVGAGTLPPGEINREMESLVDRVQPSGAAGGVSQGFSPRP